MAEIRLQKVLANAGLGSRRKCEEFIAAGRVTVDGVVVDELGSRVDPDTQIIHVDGVRIAQASGNVVYALNKPRGVVTTMSDPQGRPCVGDLIADMDVRLFYVGRLDADTDGLLLLTNDGELANRLGHPSHGISKTYVAKIQGLLSKQEFAQLLSGVLIEDRKLEVENARIIGTDNSSTVIELTIHEGRNRIVRRVFDELGHPVIDLVRTNVGPVALGRLRSGEIREVTHKELGSLYQAVGL
jgi:23S rRNA pseudouridine2605 synthase